MQYPNWPDVELPWICPCASVERLSSRLLLDMEIQP